MSPTNNTTALDSKMNQDVFTQLYQSLSPAMGTTPAQDSQSVFDEWLKQDFLSEYSSNSSPDVSTPLDQFLMSPPYQSKDELKNNKPAFGGVDLDVSAILSYPDLSNIAKAVNQASTPASTTATTPVADAASSPASSVAATPVVPMSNLFADISESIPAALAALASVAAPTTTSTSKSSTVSPAVVSASTPAFSASPSRTRKRAEDIDPSDEAAVKRQKNTDAARRSRLRKVQKMECLETRVSELEKINGGLLMRVAVLDSEKNNLKAKESSYENRIRVLEEQLAEAHKALSGRS